MPLNGIGSSSCSSLQTLKKGPLAQLVERHAYTVDVIGSIPVGPTVLKPQPLAGVFFLSMLLTSKAFHNLPSWPDSGPALVFGYGFI